MSTKQLDPDPDLRAMTAGERLDWLIDRLARIDARLAALENRPQVPQVISDKMAYHQGQLDQQGRNIEGLRRQVGELRSEIGKGPAARLLVNRMHLSPTPPAPAIPGSPPTTGAGASTKGNAQ